MKFEINFKDLYNEEWRQIDGSDYYVSNYGRVANFNYRNTGKRILMKTFTTKAGYYQIALVNNGKRIKKYVHRLIAEAFIPNPQNKPEIDHIDTNRVNNSIDNLRWVTKIENLNNPNTILNRSIAQKNRFKN